MRIAFWNVAGLMNKDKEFWRRLNEWQVILLMETWVDEKGWEKVKDKLSRGFDWRMQAATRKNKKGEDNGENNNRE